MSDTQIAPTVEDGTMLDALAARRPGAINDPAMMLFGQFVGAWDVQVTYRTEGGTEVRSGEWLFDWILEGRGIQDVWRVPSRAESARTGAPIHGYGTTVRFYDPSIQAWRSTWHGVIKGEVICFVGRGVGEEIHLEDRSAAPRIRRWAFSAITQMSFHWRNEHSTDGGATWRLDQEMAALRRD